MHLRAYTLLALWLTIVAVAASNKGFKFPPSLPTERTKAFAELEGIGTNTKKSVKALGEQNRVDFMNLMDPESELSIEDKRGAIETMSGRIREAQGLISDATQEHDAVLQTAQQGGHIRTSTDKVLSLPERIGTVPEHVTDKFQQTLDGELAKLDSGEVAAVVDEAPLADI